MRNPSMQKVTKGHLGNKPKLLLFLLTFLGLATQWFYILIGQCKQMVLYLLLSVTERIDYPIKSNILRYSTPVLLPSLKNRTSIINHRTNYKI